MIEERQIVVARVQGKKSDDTFEDIITDDAGRLQVFDPQVFGSVGGLVLSGTVTAAVPGVSFTIDSLKGLGAGKFYDATAPYRAFVLRTALGTSLAPQGEMAAITGYTTASGLFTPNGPPAFTVDIAAGDEVLILHPRIAEIFDILTIVQSIAGGTYWQTFGPGNVQVSNAVTLGVSVFDPGGGIIPQANITPGTYAIDRIRLGVLAHIASSPPDSSKSDGAVYINYAFPGASWAIGDLFVVTFTGIQVTISGVVTSFPPIQVWGRVVMEPDIDSIVTTINTNQGNPAADTLISTTAKLGNLARTLKLLLGARWDAAGDLGTDIAVLLASGIAISGTVVDGTPTIIDFDTSIVEVTNNHFNGGLLLFLNGPNIGQSHLIDVYTGAGGNVAFAINDRWTDIPGNSDAFIIIPNDGAYLKKIFTAINAIGGDPWKTLVPDAYGAGSAGKILGTNLDALVSSRLAAAAYTAERGTDNAALAADWTNALATALGNYTAALATALGLDAAPTAVGKLQIKARTFDVQQAGPQTYDLFTATTQDVVVEKFVIRFSGGAVGGTVTSISIQTDDATPQVIIPVTLVAVLTNEAQLAWTGAILLDAGTSAKIRLTIAGGAAGAANLADVIAEYRAVVAGGNLT